MNKLILFTFSAAMILSLFSCQPRPIGGKLEGTNWILVSTIVDRQTTTLSDSVKITTNFGKDKVTGNAPCNSYFANFKTDGPTLEITEIGATERMCDFMDLENSYLGLLTKANSYSVLKGKMEIYAENGRLVFVPMSDQDVKEVSFKNGLGKLADMFPVMEGDIMPHLYPILKVDNPGNYPYKGQLIDTAFYKFFDAETSNIWNSTGGDVFAIGKFDNLYVCRVPGRYVSSDIALFQIMGGAMTRSETVAWAWCDEGWCNQQDAWLRDVNKDGLTDLVQHYTLTDDKGKIKEERLTVQEQAQDGTFKENKELKPDKSQFKMANI